MSNGKRHGQETRPMLQHKETHSFPLHSLAQLASVFGKQTNSSYKMNLTNLMTLLYEIIILLGNPKHVRYSFESARMRHSVNC